MLLRRFTKHIEDQNWFAVGLDFLIVVVGVFIGIQVANWNDSRALSAQERSYLVQLRTELENNQEIIEYQIEYVEALVMGGEQGLGFLASDGDCGDECANILIGFFHASQVWGTDYSMSIYETARALGFPRNPSVRESIQVFQKTVQGWGVVNTNPPAFRERIRGHFDPATTRTLWSKCYGVGLGQIEKLTYECEADLGGMNLKPMMARIHADTELNNQLRFWVGQNIYALQEYPTFLVNVELAIDALDKELGINP